MKERPILFSAPMVRAILAGTKTQTRRVVKPRNDCDFGCQLAPHELAGEANSGEFRNSYCARGDRLWVREAFMHEPADYCWEASVSIPCRPASTVYRADFHESQPGEGWKPSIHMPRAASRILLEVTAVRVERLQDISATDAIAEGLSTRLREHDAVCHLLDQYRDLWESINGPESWDANPFVWVVEFKRVTP